LAVLKWINSKDRDTNTRSWGTHAFDRHKLENKIHRMRKIAGFLSQTAREIVMTTESQNRK
jgi:hypothetical protein